MDIKNREVSSYEGFSQCRKPELIFREGASSIIFTKLPVVFSLYFSQPLSLAIRDLKVGQVSPRLGLAGFGKASPTNQIKLKRLRLLRKNG